MQTYFLSAEADEDIQDIFLFTEEKWGDAQAREYVLRLFKAFDLIGRNPRMGRLRKELWDGIRSLPLAAHVVFFMEWHGEAAILRVLHKSRDFEDLFGFYDPVDGIDDSKR